MRFLATLLFYLLILSPFQQIYTKEDDHLQLAKDSENPLAKLTALPVRLNIYPHVTAAAGGDPTTGFPGAGSTTGSTQKAKNSPWRPIDLFSDEAPPEKFRGTLNTIDINPVVPISITERQYLLLRWQQAISFAENVYEPHSYQNGLGDANPSFAYAYAFTKDLFLGLGGALVIPTATTHFLGQGKWSAGPAITGVWAPGRFVMGFLAQNIFSFAGPRGRPDINIMTIQPGFSYNFDHGWFLSSQPYIIANWNNPPGQKWTIPIGGGIGKLIKTGSQPLTIALAVYWYPVKPNGGPDYSVRISLKYLFPQVEKKNGS
jgi:hypothetical protein